MTDTPAADADLKTPNAALNPVLNDPFGPPRFHWEMDESNRATNKRMNGRRLPLATFPIPKELPQGYKPQPKLTNEEDINDTVRKIRELVGEWRKQNYPRVTRTTRQLLEYWTSPDDRQGVRLFFAQVEAMETLIYFTEFAPTDQDGQKTRKNLLEESKKLNDGIERLAVKMATGTGKTAVMGMTIAWHTLNAAHAHALSDKERARYHSNFLVLAPGLTVKERLQVLLPSHHDNIYEQMNLIPQDMRSGLNNASIVVYNFQKFKQKSRTSGRAKKLMRKTDEDNTEEYDAMLCRLLREDADVMKDEEKICVINDEAHHCYLPETKSRSSEEDKHAAVWFNAIRGLRDIDYLGAVYDYSATPLFISTTGRKKSDMFPWVVSDYPLTDAIEAGLVKTPRFPVSDDSGIGGGEGTVKWRNLYNSTKEATSKTELEKASKPNVVRNAFKAVYENYKNVDSRWKEKDSRTPPVLIVVADNIHNAEVLYKWLAGDHSSDDPAKRINSNFGLFSNSDLWSDLRAFKIQSEEIGKLGENAGQAPPPRHRACGRSSSIHELKMMK